MIDYYLVTLIKPIFYKELGKKDQDFYRLDNTKLNSLSNPQSRRLIKEVSLNMDLNELIDKTHFDYEQNETKAKQLEDRILKALSMNGLQYLIVQKQI